jgi:hypothetical protein
MQYQVPQFIETEDTIVGPFTMRQFIYVAVAGGFSFMLYFTVQTWLWVILSIFLVSGALAFSLVKIGGRPLTHVAISAFNFFWKPQTYTWQPERPELRKNEANMEKLAAPGISLEKIISGLALKNVWQQVQTGSKMSGKQFLGKMTEHYEVFRKTTGEREAARRVDYR